MTMMNNYDTCSYMESCELTAYHDTHESQRLWDDSFERIEFVGHRSGIYFYTSCGQMSKPDHVSDLFEIEDAEPTDINRCLRERAGEDYYYQKLEMLPIEERKDYCRDYLNEDFSFHCYIRGNIPNYFKEKYCWTEVTGYCQGDYAYVVYDPEHWSEGARKNDSYVRRYFEQLFYDAPFYVKLEVDGEEFDFTEHISDMYNYDRKELERIAREVYGLKDRVVNWFVSKLPQHLDYIN